MRNQIYGRKARTSLDGATASQFGRARRRSSGQVAWSMLEPQQARRERRSFSWPSLPVPVNPHPELRPHGSF